MTKNLLVNGSYLASSVASYIYLIYILIKLADGTQILLYKYKTMQLAIYKVQICYSNFLDYKLFILNHKILFLFEKHWLIKLCHSIALTMNNEQHVFFYRIYNNAFHEMLCINPIYIYIKYRKTTCEYQTKGTMYKRAGSYLQGIRRIKLSLRGLHIIASIDCGVYMILG